MIKRIIVLCALLCASNSMAASESLVKEYIDKSDLIATMERDIRKARGGLPADKVDKFISLINFKKIETAYAQSLMKVMTNEEISALIKAYNIPGYKTAARKQIAASAPLITTITEELQRAAKVLSQEK